MSDNDDPIDHLDESVSSWDESSSNDERPFSRNKAIYGRRQNRFRQYDSNSSRYYHKRHRNHGNNNRKRYHYTNRRTRTNHFSRSPSPSFDSSSSDEDKSNEFIVYITRIPRGVTPKQLSHSFSRCVDILDSYIAKNKHTGAHLGFGFIKVKNKEDEQKVLDWCFVPRFKDIVTGKMVTLKIKKYNSELSRYMSRLYKLDVNKPSFPNRGEISDLYSRDRNQIAEKRRRGRSRRKKRYYSSSSQSSSHSRSISRSRSLSRSSFSSDEYSSSEEDDIAYKKTKKKDKKKRNDEEDIKKYNNYRNIKKIYYK